MTLKGIPMKFRHLNILALIVFLAALPVSAQNDLRTTFGPGVPFGVGSIGAGTDLQRHRVDQTVFPLARCNDNTPAVIYFRPYSGAANANKWVIHLNGGGSCGSGLSCSERWFSVGTAFNRNNMTSQHLPLGTNGNGVLERDSPFGQENPFANYNQVLVHYCSSDNWAGTKADEALQGFDFRPTEMTCKMYTISFLGRPIFDAVIDTLRRNGVAALNYLRPQGGSQLLPDLDEADLVVLTGGSAGGAGVINNLDHLRLMLPPRIRVAGITDSAFRPSRELMDLSQTLGCRSFGACTVEAQNQLNFDAGPYSVWGAVDGSDRSCLLYHSSDPAQCTDTHHILTDHLTTPFFVRMDETDPNGLRDYTDDGIFVANSPDPDPDTDVHEPMSEEDFARAVRRDMLSIALVPFTAHERFAINFAPGAFSPRCGQHDELRSNDGVYRTSIRRGNKQMFDVIRSWLTGNGSGIVVSLTQNDSDCPPVRDAAN
jgi:hypothetical protein